MSARRLVLMHLLVVIAAASCRLIESTGVDDPWSRDVVEMMKWTLIAIDFSALMMWRTWPERDPRTPSARGSSTSTGAPS